MGSITVDVGRVSWAFVVGWSRRSDPCKSGRVGLVAVPDELGRKWLHGSVTSESGRTAGGVTKASSVVGATSGDAGDPVVGCRVLVGV